MRERVSRRLIGASDSLYRLLLDIYPRQFRQEYGPQMAQLTYGLNRVDAKLMREIDLAYLKRRSLGMDAKLLLRTFVMLMRQVSRD